MTLNVKRYWTVDFFSELEWVKRFILDLGKSSFHKIILTHFTMLYLTSRLHQRMECVHLTRPTWKGASIMWQPVSHYDAHKEWDFQFKTEMDV